MASRDQALFSALQRTDLRSACTEAPSNAKADAGVSARDQGHLSIEAIRGEDGRHCVDAWAQTVHETPNTMAKEGQVAGTVLKLLMCACRVLLSLSRRLLARSLSSPILRCYAGTQVAGYRSR